MKVQSTIIAAALGFSLIFVSAADAQERGNDSPRVSPNASVSQTIGTTIITITYGRPAVNEREIFGGLVPLDEVWRTGANESTVITFSEDVRIEGEDLEAGTYSLYTLPGSEEWGVIFNSILSWGTQYDEEGDVLRVTVQPEEGIFMEQMMIYFEDVTEQAGHMIIHWDEVKVPVQIEVMD